MGVIFFAQNDKTPLAYASAKGNDGVAEALLANKANVNAQDRVRTTTLELR